MTAVMEQASTSESADLMPAGGGAPVAVHLDVVEAERLGGQIVAAASRVASVTAAWVEMVGIFDAGGGHHHAYFPSAAHWLAWACSMSPGTAREHVRVARGLRVMPVIAAAFGRGELSFSKVRECTRLAGVIDEDVLLKCARDFTAAQLERAVRGYRAGRSARLVAETHRGVSERELPDGSVQITAILAPEEAAVVRAALDVAVTRYRTETIRARREHASAEPTLDDAVDTDLVDGDAVAGIAACGVPAGTLRPGPAGADVAAADVAVEEDQVPSYSRVDALIDVARGYLDAGPTDTSGEDRDIVVVHVSEDALHAATHPACQADPASRPDPSGAARDDGVGGEVGVPAGTPPALATETTLQPISAERMLPEVHGVSATPADADPSGSAGLAAPGCAWIEGIGSVHASTAARIACTGLITPVVLTETGEVLTLGRERRLANRAQRRALMARDKHCQFPGCTRAVRLHAHHLTAWVLGGLTDVDAMILLCQYHHVTVHAASITITKNARRRGFTFTRIDGTEITAQRPDEYSRPSVPGTDMRPHAEHALLERLTADVARGEPPVIDHTEPLFAPPVDRASALTGSQYRLPEEMRDLADVADQFDPRAGVFPRWAGERLTEGDLWELTEEGALTERTNHDARY